MVDEDDEADTTGERLVALEIGFAELRAMFEHHEKELLELRGLRVDMGRLLVAATKHGLMLESMHRALAAGHKRDSHHGAE